jgi:hypothetical protein
MKSLNILRYLNFEVNRACDLWKEHQGKCPISHPWRYKFSTSTKPISDDLIVEFWRWCRRHDFRGIVMWHMYNEPTLVLDRIRNLMTRMKEEDPGQPFQITTNSTPNIPGFDIVKFSDYRESTLSHNGRDKLDNRIASAEGEGKPYSEVEPVGWCGRGLGWELDIDYYGNWCLCCNDWRCEESVGNIHEEEWEVLYERFKAKSERIRWHDEESYNALPRMCRSCMAVNPALRVTGGI